LDVLNLNRIFNKSVVESDVAALNIGLATVIIKDKIDRHGGRSWKWQCPLDKPHDDDDDDDDKLSI